MQNQFQLLFTCPKTGLLLSAWLLMPGGLINVMIPGGTAGTSHTLRLVSSTPVGINAGSANFKAKACCNTREAVRLQVKVSPNTVPEGRLRISVSGAAGRALRVECSRAWGKLCGNRTWRKRGSRNPRLGYLAPTLGLVLLARKPDTESKTLKVLH